MDSIISQISKIKKATKKFYTCNYLYGGFDTLVKSIEAPENNPLTEIEMAELKNLIRVFAEDNHYSTTSPNWIRYSARCFYCADYLTRYISDTEERNSMTDYLNGCFNELAQSTVAPIIPEETLDKYIQINLVSSNAKDIYANLLERAIRGSQKGRTWSSDEMAFRVRYTWAIKSIILKYVNDYSDRSVLKEWFPLLETVRLAELWYEYPDSGNYRHSRERTRMSVEDSLDKMLNVHLELFSYWYWHNPQELIDTLPMNDIIEILEVSEDDEFEKILRHTVTLPWNEKVEGVLKHFLEDDEQWIVKLSQQLLETYHSINQNFDNMNIDYRIYYRKDDRKVVLTGISISEWICNDRYIVVTEKDGVLTLPEIIDGLYVESISDTWFMGLCGKDDDHNGVPVSKLIIPSSYRRLGKKNFSRWNSLKQVSLFCPATALCEWNFAYCYELREVHCFDNSMYEYCVNLPKGMRDQAWGCFDDCLNNIRFIPE